MNDGCHIHNARLMNVKSVRLEVLQLQTDSVKNKTRQDKKIAKGKNYNRHELQNNIITHGAEL
jgi:hypothetical protein